VGNDENRTAVSSVSGTGHQESHLDSASGFPSAALLGETMHSTRQIVVDQAGALLSVSCRFQNLISIYLLI
jgi:large proline-rich protein BAG6